MFRICVVAIILIKYCVCDSKKCVLNSTILRCGEEVESIPKASEFGNSLIRFLDLNNCSKLKFANGDLDGYEMLGDLELSYINMSYQRGNVSLDKFYNLKNLISFSFSYSELTDEEMWTLPEKLQTYRVDGNKYTRLNLSMCPQITRIYANNNQLTNIPILSNPLPLLVELHLKNNNLSSLTVEDIAPLCHLQVLSLEIPPDVFLKKDNGSCECKRLSSWLSMFNINGSTLSCVDPPADAKCDLNCTYIMQLRRDCSDEILPGCPTANNSVSSGLPAQIIQSTPTSWNNTIFLAVYGLIGFFLLTALAFFVYRYNPLGDTDELVENYLEGKAIDAEEAEEENE